MAQNFKGPKGYTVKCFHIILILGNHWIFPKGTDAISLICVISKHRIGTVNVCVHPCILFYYTSCS